MALANRPTTPNASINVTGQQWWWEYDYPVSEDGTICGVAPTSAEASPIITSGQLVIPTETKVLVRGTSRDVIHCFWIPKLNGKKDIVPGRVHYLRMQADEPGIYAGQCTEFCGLSHANMRMEAVALDPADFQRWVDNQLEPYTVAGRGHRGGRGRSALHPAVLALSPGQRARRRQGQRRPERRRARRVGPRRVRVQRCRAEPHQPDDPQHVRRRHAGTC